MGIEENKRIVLEFDKRMAEGDVSALDELTTDDFIHHFIDVGMDAGKDIAKQARLSVAPSFPDYSTHIEDIIAEGDKVVIWVTCTGTQTGQYRSIAPTGNKVKFAQMVIYRMENGKIAESWQLHDFLSLYQQLGVLPSLEEIGK